MGGITNAWLVSVETGRTGGTLHNLRSIPLSGICPNKFSTYSLGNTGKYMHIHTVHIG